MIDKKEEICKIASKMFLMHGFDSVSMESIFNNTNVSKIVFYTLFSEKSNLITECLIQEERDFNFFVKENIKNSDYIGNIQSIYLWHLNQIVFNKKSGLLFLKIVNSSNSSKHDYFIARRIWETHISLINEQLRGLNVENSKLFSIVFLNTIENIYYPLDDDFDYIAMWHLLESFLKSVSKLYQLIS